MKRGPKPAAVSKPGSGKYEALLARCRSLKPIPTAVAHPCEASALAGAIEAGRNGLIVPILVGPRAKVAATAREAQIDLQGIQVVDAPHSHESAALAVGLARPATA